MGHNEGGLTPDDLLNMESWLQKTDYSVSDMAFTPVMCYFSPNRDLSSYFKVGSHSSDAALFKMLSSRRSQQLYCRRKKALISKFKESLTKILLENCCLRTWSIYREFANTTKDYSLYKEAIVAAANFACLLISKDRISDYGMESHLRKQLSELWEYVSNDGKMRLPSVKVWKKSFCQLKSKPHKYNLVTEPHLASLIKGYHIACASFPFQFDKPHVSTNWIPYSRFSYEPKTSAAVTLLIEVAELRRRALGRRFINIDIFLWSFYKCGYGLPPRVCDGLVLNIDGEDHPLSQIYAAVVKLVASLGLKTIELEHFVFVMLYPNAIDDVGVKHMTQSSQEHFKAFMEEVVLDTEMRTQVICRDGFPVDVEGGLFNLNLKTEAKVDC